VFYLYHKLKIKAMEIIKVFLKELESEAAITRKMLGRIPNDRYDWQPHPKSMTIRQLANHIVELPGWITMAITTDELDFGEKAYAPAQISDTKELIGTFNELVAEAKETLWQTSEKVLEKNWVLREGDAIYLEGTKAEIVRVSLNQITHHRAQLGVFLRLLDIPIPGSYGPSADEHEFEEVAQA
jgi:uncharacterized damage-inducible protein DinB